MWFHWSESVYHNPNERNCNDRFPRVLINKWSKEDSITLQNAVESCYKQFSVAINHSLLSENVILWILYLWKSCDIYMIIKLQLQNNHNKHLKINTTKQNSNSFGLAKFMFFFHTRFSRYFKWKWWLLPAICFQKKK